MIPNNFDIFSEKSSKKKVKRNGIPKVISKRGDNFELWFLQDKVFKRPRVIVNVIFYIPDMADSPLKVVQNDAFIDLLHEKIYIEIGYTALCADLDYQIRTF